MNISKRLNYIGSKYSLLDFLHVHIKEVIKQDISELSFCDMFAGSCVVSRYFKPLVKEVISNDLEYYSYVLAQNYLCSDATCKESAIFEKLNNLEGVEGFIFKHYTQGDKSSRLYFSDENGKKIDAIRLKIEELYQEKHINTKLYFHLLASLIESTDSIANTASIYSAYLKKLKKTAKEPFILKPSLFDETEQNNQVYNEDANELIKKISGDILYLDPPYNIRQYGSNYHILNTLVQYNNFLPSGITGVRDYTRSAYCSKKYVYDELDNLIKEAKFSYIFMSYNNEGILSSTQIKEIFEKYGVYSVVTKKHNRFKAQSKKEYYQIVESLHILVKN